MVDDDWLSLAMAILMSLARLGLVGVTVSHPGLVMTMHAIASEAVTVVCAAEPAVEKLCCRTLYRGNTAEAPCAQRS